MDGRTDGQMAERVGLSMCSFKLLLMGPQRFFGLWSLTTYFTEFGPDELIDQVWWMLWPTAPSWKAWITRSAMGVCGRSTMWLVCRWRVFDVICSNFLLEDSVGSQTWEAWCMKFEEDLCLNGLLWCYSYYAKVFARAFSLVVITYEIEVLK